MAVRCTQCRADEQRVRAAGHSFGTVFAECNEHKTPRHEPPLFVTVTDSGAPSSSGASHGECLHGVVAGCIPNASSGTGCPTAFPNSGSLGASFNTTLWLHVGSTIGKERRAMSNVVGQPSGRCALLCRGTVAPPSQRCAPRSFARPTCLLPLLAHTLLSSLPLCLSASLPLSASVPLSLPVRSLSLSVSVRVRLSICVWQCQFQ